jgi:hypothetical protein
MEIEHIKNQGVTFWFKRFGPKCDPPVFDVFYLHKYSHGFINFIDIVIQFFQKMSVMTVATLVMKTFVTKNSIIISGKIVIGRLTLVWYAWIS